MPDTHFNKVTGLRSAALIKKSLWHKCFSVNFTKFLGTPFLKNTSKQLLLRNVNRLEPMGAVSEMIFSLFL